MLEPFAYRAGLPVAKIAEWNIDVAGIDVDRVAHFCFGKFARDVAGTLPVANDQ
jgi:hypothetical protein